MFSVSGVEAGSVSPSAERTLSDILSISSLSLEDSSLGKESLVSLSTAFALAISTSSSLFGVSSFLFTESKTSFGISPSA